jgi:hypothetical protein
MTAIILNLLAEEQQAQTARARDPLKIFIAVGLAVLSVAVACGSALSVISGQKAVELQGIETRWKKLNGNGGQEDEFQKIRALAEEIVAVNNSRAVVAPELALVKDLIPPTVRLSQISFSLAVTIPKVENSGDGGISGKRVARLAPIERLALRLEGIAISSRPELEVDKFLQTLRDNARFGAVIDDIQLRSESRTSVDIEKTGRAVPGANFVIECRYKEKVKK